jgi:hypothetical protein
MPASGFAREVRLETKKVLSCEQEEATMPEATQARQVHLWGQEGAF